MNSICLSTNRFLENLLFVKLEDTVVFVHQFLHGEKVAFKAKANVLPNELPVIESTK